MNTAFSVQPPLPPRPLTPAIRRRSWGQAGVRGWLTMALVMWAIALYVLAGQAIAIGRDWWLVHHGVAIKATILEAGGNPLNGKTYPAADNLEFKLQLQLPNRPPMTIVSRLKDQRQPLGPPMEIPLFVDPNDPSRWTDRQEIALGHDLLLGASLLPVAIVLLGIALFCRARTLRIWRLGEVQAAIVVKVGQSAMAPGGRVVHLVLRDARQKRPFATFAPASADQLQPGDVVWALTPPGKVHHGVLYHQ